jgi:hypothetical protein
VNSFAVVVTRMCTSLAASGAPSKLLAAANELPSAPVKEPPKFTLFKIYTRVLLPRTPAYLE